MKIISRLISLVFALKFSSLVIAACPVANYTSVFINNNNNRLQQLELYAHRGGVHSRSHFPEPYIGVLDHLVKRKYQGVEIDVLETKDHELVAYHYNRLDRHFKKSCVKAGYYPCAKKSKFRCSLGAWFKGKTPCLAENITMKEILTFRTVVGDYGISSLKDYLIRADLLGFKFMIDHKSLLGKKGREKFIKIINDLKISDKIIYIGNLFTSWKLRKTIWGNNAKKVKTAFPLSRGYRLFKGIGNRDYFYWGHGRAANLKNFKKIKNVKEDVIISINTGHYKRQALKVYIQNPDYRKWIKSNICQKDEVWDYIIKSLADRDMINAYLLGVRKFQIDPEIDNFIVGIP